MFKRSFCFIDGEYLEATRAFHILGTFGLFVSFLLAFSGISGKGERFLKLRFKICNCFRWAAYFLGKIKIMFLWESGSISNVSLRCENGAEALKSTLTLQLLWPNLLTRRTTTVVLSICIEQLFKPFSFQVSTFRLNCLILLSLA